jgi:ribosome-binding factor A
MRSTRLRRTDDLVRKVISEALLTKVQDPRIGLVSVTGVRVSPEFDTAKVFVSIYGDAAAREESLRGLRSAASFLQSELARAVRLRRTPRLRFIHDESLERGNRVEAVLRELSVETTETTSEPEGNGLETEGRGGDNETEDR